METNKIHLDMCPYDVVAFQKKIIVKDCMGSVLGKLDSRVETTNFKGSDLHNSIKLPCGKFAYVTIDGDDVVFTLYAHHPHNAKLKLDNLLVWIRDNYDRIESIGWETLTQDWKIIKEL